LKRTFVVDASVAIKWFLPEIYSEKASLILETKWELLAPDLIWAEFGSALRKKVRQKEVTTQEAEGILRDFMRFPFQIYGCKLLLNLAWQMAHESGNTFYDSLYLALADNFGCSLITADKKLYESFRKGKANSNIIWVEDIGDILTS